MLEQKISQKNLLLVALIACTFVTNIALAKDKGHKHGSKHNQHTKTVNCNKGKASVQSEIDKVKFGQDTTIFIDGFCDESVSIVKDGITLSGNKSGNDILGGGGGLTEVTVTGAQRVVIEYLELKGSGYGVLVQEGASAAIRHNHIHGNVAAGVAVYNLAFARVEFNLIEKNGRLSHYEAGIEGGSSSIRSRGNIVRNNAYAAVGMGNNGFFRSGLFIPQGGTLDLKDKDTFLQKGCTDDPDTSDCAADGSLAIECYRSGTCELRNTEVVGNIDISGMSNFEARTTSIYGDVDGSGGSGLNLQHTVSGKGWVSCDETAFTYGSIECDEDISKNTPTP